MFFLNKLRNFVKYIVHKNDSHITIRILQQKNLEKIEIVINNINYLFLKNVNFFDLVVILFCFNNVITNNLC